MAKEAHCRPDIQINPRRILHLHQLYFPLSPANTPTLSPLVVYSGYTMSQDFCLTAQDPDVLAFLEYAGAALLYAEKKAHGKESEAKQPICNDLRWHDISQRTSWWRVEYGGVAHPEAVANVVGKSETMSLDEARLIFVVAALSVYNLPSHPAHWAFWARNSKQRVAELVHEVVCEYLVIGVGVAG